MKSTVAPYETAAWCVRIVTVSGPTIRLTTYPFDLTMSNATVYETDSGYEATAYSSNANMSAASIDIEGFVGVAGITRDQIASGVFDNARVYIFKCDYLSPVEDYEPVTAGLFGKTTISDDRYRVEGMALVDALSQSIGMSVTPGCQRTFGDAGCGIVLTSVDVVGSVTHVTSATVFRDSSRTEAADWFGAGTLEFTSGQNAGLPKLMVQAYAADGTITVVEPPYYTPQVGDTYVMVPGCRKRGSDCKDKWSNKVNFLGFEDIPSPSQYTFIGGLS